MAIDIIGECFRGARAGVRLEQLNDDESERRPRLCVDYSFLICRTIGAIMHPTPR